MAEALRVDSYLSRLLSGQRRVYCPHGTREKADYFPVYDRAGVWHLEKKDTPVQTYLEIQSYADECDINVLMARYRAGDTDVLSRVQGVYGDFSLIPTNYAEIMNEKLRAEQLFYSLSADVRSRYNNSVEQFMSEIGTKSGLEKLGVKFEAPASPEPEQKEVKDDA